MLHWRRAFHSTLTTLDQDHALLFQRFNHLEKLGTLKRQADHAEANRIIDDLLEYALAHCAREEAVMREAGYPETEAHTRSHDAMRECFVEILRSLTAGAIPLPTFVTLIRGQFLKHFMKDDYPFVTWLRQRSPGFHPEVFLERRRSVRNLQRGRERRAVD